MSDTYEKLLGAAFRFLSFRARSEKELLEFLTKKAQRFDDGGDVVLRVMERLRELNYVNDEAFAVWWVEQRSGRKPKGAALIARELAQKGVAKEVIEAVLGRLVDPEGQFEAAKRAISPKLPAWRHLPLLARKKKLYDHLARRGFASSVISRVIDWATKKDYNTEA